MACSATDYAIVAGDPLDSASDPPIVAFRASSQAPSGYDDVLMAHHGLKSTKLIYFVMDNDAYCGPQAVRTFGQTLSIKALSFLGNGNDAVMITYEVLNPKKQVLVLMRNVATSTSFVDEYYEFTYDGMVSTA